MLTMILAIDKNNLIGNTQTKNGLPWHYPEDLQFYKEKTINKINIMGRKTYVAIGKALPQRETYVLTTNKELNFSDSTMLYSKDDVIELLNNNADKEIMLIGGVSIFEELFNLVDKIYLTYIDAEHTGDIYYNNLSLENFKLVNEEIKENKNIKFQTWEKK